MPFINIEAGAVSSEQKKALIEEVTATASRILNTPPNAFYVLIKENNTDNWGVGGKMLTELKKGKQA